MTALDGCDGSPFNDVLDTNNSPARSSQATRERVTIMPVMRLFIVDLPRSSVNNDLPICKVL